MFCPNCGKELPPGGRHCEVCGRRRPGSWLWRALGIGLVAVLLLAVAVVVGYRQYRFHQLKTQLETAIGTDAGYTETILKIESDSTNITFGEVFSLCDKSVEDRQKLIVELRGLYPDIRYDLKDKLIDFLNAENDLVRGKRGFYRQQIELSTAVELLTDHLRDRPTSVYGWEFHVSRSVKLTQEARDKAIEMVARADAFLAAYRKTAGQEEALAKQMGAEGLRFIEVFRKYQQSHLSIAVDAKKSAEELSRSLAS